MYRDKLLVLAYVAASATGRCAEAALVAEEARSGSKAYVHVHDVILVAS